jgi:hypothetical protein
MNNGKNVVSSPRLHKLTEVFWLEPSDLVIRLPELASLVDVDLAGLLGVSLAELLADAESVDAGLEDASLAAQVGSAGETESGGEVHFCLVQLMPVRVGGEVEHLSLPVGLQCLTVAPG